jgi:hypothetical protein
MRFLGLKKPILRVIRRIETGAGPRCERLKTREKWPQRVQRMDYKFPKRIFRFKLKEEVYYRKTKEEMVGPKRL